MSRSNQSNIKVGNRFKSDGILLDQTDIKTGPFLGRKVALKSQIQGRVQKSGFCHTGTANVDKTGAIVD